MSMSRQAGIVLPGYNALKVANAPTIGTATSASGTSVSVAFTAPSCVGGGAISSYTAYCTTTGTNTTSGASSPLTVSGLTTGNAYTFKVSATNAYGPSYPSAASNSATPVAQGQQAYTTAGTFSWVAPAGVTSVSVVAVGGGGKTAVASGSFAGGGGGGGLGYQNNITVIPGNSYSVVVGAGGTGSCSTTGGTSSFNSALYASGGSPGTSSAGGAGGTYSGTAVGGGTGGAGGAPGACSGYGTGSGGGAAGYAGNGGFGSSNGGTGPLQTGGAGAGGGASGGGGGYPGGGVGLLGQGTSGVAVTGTNGRGGSCGANGAYPTGGLYGGGGPGDSGGYGGYPNNSVGARGAVRIIWPGTTRQFPSTNTGNL